MDLTNRKCVTKELKLFGHDKPVPVVSIQNLSSDSLKELIKNAVANEMCMTVEDFLSRRTRQLLLDAKAAIQSAPLVAQLMGQQK